MTPRPLHQYGFADPDIKRHGCTVVALASLAYWASDDTLDTPHNRLAQRLRDLSGVPLATFRERGTTLTEAERAFEALRFPGRTKPAMRLMRGARVRDEIIPELKDGGAWALVAVNYGVIQDAKRGDGSAFRGGHAILVGEPDGNSVARMDPLLGKIDRIPIPLLVEAMETFGSKPWGGGRGEAGVVTPTITILALRTRQRDTARAERDRARADLAIAEHRLTTTRGVLTLTTEERDTARREVERLTRAMPSQDERDLLGAAFLLQIRNGEELRAAVARPPADCAEVERERDGAIARANAEARRNADAVAVLTAPLPEVTP